MPEREENNQLYRNKLENRLLVLNVLLDLVVELNQAVHGNGDSDCIKAGDPNVREFWAKRGLAVPVRGLGDETDESHQDVNAAILVDANPHGLQEVR